MTNKSSCDILNSRIRVCHSVHLILQHTPLFGVLTMKITTSVLSLSAMLFAGVAFAQSNSYVQPLGDEFPNAAYDDFCQKQKDAEKFSPGGIGWGIQGCVFSEGKWVNEQEFSANVNEVWYKKLAVEHGLPENAKREDIYTAQRKRWNREAGFPEDWTSEQADAEHRRLWLKELGLKVDATDAQIDRASLGLPMSATNAEVQEAKKKMDEKKA